MCTPTTVRTVLCRPLFFVVDDSLFVHNICQFFSFSFFFGRKHAFWSNTKTNNNKNNKYIAAGSTFPLFLHRCAGIFRFFFSLFLLLVKVSGCRQWRNIERLLLFDPSKKNKTVCDVLICCAYCFTSTSCHRCRLRHDILALRPPNQETENRSNAHKADSGCKFRVYRTFFFFVFFSPQI